MKKIAKIPIFKKENLYHCVMVYEESSIRTLRLGKGPRAGKQSQIDIRDLGRHMLEYTKLVFAGLLINQNPMKALIIGLGGGVIPRDIHDHFPDSEIHVVDIDPDVLEAAERFFFFKTDKRLHAHISDGRLFILQELDRRPRQVYDMIILDAFHSEYIPFHLTTREFLEQVEALLHPKGVVVANVLRDHHLFHSQLKTFRAVFGRSYVFVGKRVNNTILISPGPEAPDLDFRVALERADILHKRHRFGFDMNDVARQFRPRFRTKWGAKILTDESPVLYQ